MMPKAQTTNGLLMFMKFSLNVETILVHRAQRCQIAPRSTDDPQRRQPHDGPDADSHHQRNNIDPQTRPPPQPPPPPTNAMVSPPSGASDAICSTFMNQAEIENSATAAGSAAFSRKSPCFSWISISTFSLRL